MHRSVLYLQNENLLVTENRIEIAASVLILAIFPQTFAGPGARLDVSARNLWSPLAKAFIDVRVFNPQAKANWEKSIPQMYKSHEEEKKQGYLPRVLQVEKGTFTPAVFSTSGGMGKEADRLLRRMAERMSIKRGENYSSVVSFLMITVPG